MATSSALTPASTSVGGSVAGAVTAGVAASSSITGPWPREQTLIRVQTKSTGLMIFEAALMVGTIVGMSWALKKLLTHATSSATNPAEAKKAEEARAQLAAKLKRNGRADVPITDEYENRIMSDVVFPDQIRTTFDDIGGMMSVKESIHETVILPLQNPHLFATGSDSKGLASSLLSAPKGILLYGPPGTGKTMMARAIAKDCDATFIEVRLSTLENKWFGESQKLVRAMFSLAHKFAPSIIFIDEVDLFLKRRGDNEHEAMGTMKGEFMSLWDGLLSGTAMNQVTIIGATNRPWDIDPAFQRRLSRQILFALPDVSEREAILRVILRPQSMGADFPYEQVAKLTENFSGSDLTELCKYACMIPVREVIRKHREKDGKTVSNGGKLAATTKIDTPARAVALTDFVEALKHVRATGAASFEYLKQFQATSLGAGGGALGDKNNRTPGRPSSSSSSSR